MTNNAWVIGVVLVAVAMLVVVATAEDTEAQFGRSSEGRYQIAAGGDQTAWKIDTENGNVWFCAVGNAGRICTRVQDLD